MPDRNWRDLGGAVNDVEMLRQMLSLLYGADLAEIVALTDQTATRDAILTALERLAATARKDDVVFFYFAGHGSLVRNSRSDERDKLDESIVPADSRAGADDIRDKELRGYFNRILDRGARLTVVLDSCYSGSGARGLGVGAQPRGIEPDRRDVADGTSYGARPESRGALVLSASQDHEPAYETRDSENRIHGAFTWAWIRAMRDASSGEPAEQTFLRAQARMRAEKPYQSPVLAGNAEARLAPFLGTRVDRRADDTPVIAVSKAQEDTVFLQGGWANGLAAGSELRTSDGATRLSVTTMLGLGRSVARVMSGPPPKGGALLEVSAWAVPPGPPLRVAVPRAARDAKSLATFAKALRDEAVRQGLHWVTDPIASPASVILRWGKDGWELVHGRDVAPIGGDEAAIDAVAQMIPGESLFAQFPATSEIPAIESVAPEEADYLLAGRYTGSALTYAWLRPMTMRSDRRHSGLPLRTKWCPADKAGEPARSLSRLRKIHAWLTLESPPAWRFPYRLQIRRARDERILDEGESLFDGEPYTLVLRGALPMPPAVKPRFVYVFVIDSSGRSTLLYPFAEAGSVENRYPDPNTAPVDIPLDGSAFVAAEPYGIDTYVLLSTDEPLPNPSILEWDGVRAPRIPGSALEELLMLTASGARGKPITTPASWSIERVSFESVRSRATKDDD